jgi:hypothetical protein
MFAALFLISTEAKDYPLSNFYFPSSFFNSRSSPSPCVSYTATPALLCGGPQPPAIAAFLPPFSKSAEQPFEAAS